MCVCVRVFLGVFYARVPHLSNVKNWGNAVETKREAQEQSENSYKVLKKAENKAD